VSALARILAAALTADVREYREGPPAEQSAEASATSGTASNRRRPERIVSGRLHDTPAPSPPGVSERPA
jgi:hypothetical protein